MTSTVDKLVKTLNKELRKKSPNLNSAAATLRDIKLQLIHFKLIPPFHGDEKRAEAELTLARTAFELACKLSVLSGDFAGFERHMNQLKTYYFDYASVLSESPMQWEMLGLNMLHLLASSRPSAFHTELELIPQEQLENQFIAFPIHLEQDLMEGSYDKVLRASESHSNDLNKGFLAKLVDTVRDKITVCSAIAYEWIPIGEAKDLLMLKSDEEARQYALDHKWEVNDMEGRIKFPQQRDAGLDISSVPMIVRTLGYAQELEKIV